MKIEVGMKCKQTKVIEKYGFDCVGMEFEITKVNDKVIMCMGNGIGFGIEPNEFENYFEIIEEEEEVKKKENNIMNLNTNHKGKKVKIINTEGFIRDDYKDLEKYINQTGIVRWDFEGSGNRLSIKFDDKILDSINDDNGRLCFRVDNVEFIDDTCEKCVEKVHAKLGDIVELSNGLKIEICEDYFYDSKQFYKTVDINKNKVVTNYILEDNLKEYCLGNRVFGYGIDKYEIVNIKTDEVKEEKEVEIKPKNKVYIYKMIPHKINWEITHNDEIINQITDSGDESYKLIINGNTTIVILDDGCKGVAKCMESDEYDMDKGIDIAYTKAIIKSSQKKLKGLVK